MALSDIARQIIKEQLDINKGGSATKNTVEYKVETGLTDSLRDGVAATVSFKFSKPVSEDLLNVQLTGIMKHISSSLDLEGDVGAINAMLMQIVGKKGMARVGKKRTSGRVQVNFGDPEDAEGRAGAITGVSGKYVSNSNMKSVLELLAKSYLIRDMKAAGAPLKYRTGRFANSLKIKDLVTKEEDKKAPEAHITYNYMLSPYSVFNPAVSTYRGLSLRPFRGARNPQKLIGEAIAKAMRDLIHSRYKAVVKQGT